MEESRSGRDRERWVGQVVVEGREGGGGRRLGGGTEEFGDLERREEEREREGWVERFGSGKGRSRACTRNHSV